MQPDRTIDPYKLHFRRNDRYLCVGGPLHGKQMSMQGRHMQVPLWEDKQCRFTDYDAPLRYVPPMKLCMYSVKAMRDGFGDSRTYLILELLDDTTILALLRDLGELEPHA